MASGGQGLGGVQRGAQFIVYAVYGNTGVGDPIDYVNPLAILVGTSWTSDALAAPGQYKFAVRARDAASGLEEQNLDAAVELMLDATGRDVTDVPLPPMGVRALPLASGAIRVEWTCPCIDPRRQPDGFRVYLGTPQAIDYLQPVAVVPWSSSMAGAFSGTVASLVDGMAYGVNVRAFNSRGEEANTGVIQVTADGTPPALVDGLAAAATSQE
jgi:hypothetical protein